MATVGAPHFVMSEPEICFFLTIYIRDHPKLTIILIIVEIFTMGNLIVPSSQEVLGLGLKDHLISTGEASSPKSEKFKG